MFFVNITFYDCAQFLLQIKHQQESVNDVLKFVYLFYRFAGKWKDFTPWKTSQVDFIDENSEFKELTIEKHKQHIKIA